MRFVTFILGFLACLATPLAAQEVETEEAGGFIVDLLEGALSGDHRYIDVIGLEGALSSRATVRQITVADDDGIWLTINNAELDWNRLALLRRNFSVDTLSAEEIIVARAPNPVEPDPELPTPEAQPFTLPELPVAVNIGELSVARLVLQEPVIGKPAELSVNGALSLADGTLESNLEIARLDRPTDRVNLIAGFSNATSEITLDLAVEEEANGLLSEILNVPDAPALRLTAKGQGPVDDFTADIALASDGQDRMSGQVTLTGVPAPDAADSDTPQPDSIAFQAALSGDLTPLLNAEYRSFFGTQTQLDLSGRSDADGALSVQKFDLQSNALILNGALDIGATGGVQRLRLQGRIAPPDGESVVLPLTGPVTTLQAARISARVDGGSDNSWDMELALDGLERPGLELRGAQITGRGTLGQDGVSGLGGQLSAALRGLDLKDDALNRAVGSDITLNGRFDVTGQEALNLRDFRLVGSNYTALVNGAINGLNSGFLMDGAVQVSADDLSRFSGLAGRTLGGSVTARLTGSGAPLGGAFDFTLNADTRDLTTGIAQIDPLIAGKSELVLKALRDETGLRIDRFALDGQALTAQASGALRSQGSDLTFRARLDNLGRVVKQLPGPVTLAGDVKQDGQDWIGKARLDAPDGTFADLSGTFNPSGGSDITFDAALARVQRFVPEITGTVTAKGTAQNDGGIWQIASRVEGPSGSFADLDGTIDPEGAAELDFDAALTRVERFVPEIAGTVTAKGNAQRSGSTWRIDASATGPAGTSTTLNGTLDETTLNANLKANGQVQLAGINRIISPRSVRGLARFDLALNGKPSLAALSGTVSTNGASVALPNVGTTLNDVNVTVRLDNSRAQVNATGALRAGGQFRASGPINLAPPFNADLSAQLDRIVLTDNVSFESTADGQLAFNGPLMGNGTLSGQITFDETEVNIAALSGAVGAAPIPSIRHIGQPAAVYRTRDFAGLIDTGNGGTGPVYGLDLRLSAPNRIFVRGRGLQAELGGAITVRGTTANVAPAGQIGLIRGHFDILGRRLELDRGIVTLQGRLQPVMDFSASTTTSEGSATLSIAGPLDAPVIEVTAEPERPSEEALAMLVFGDEFTSLSPLKIAQLASSLATLSGRGGGGFISRLRESLGVDTLDIGTDASGEGQVGVGGYLGENIYTDFSVNAQGETEVNLNLDVTKSLTVKGKAGSSGDTSLGLFFERDY